MANTKISEMEEATSISENDILPIVKDGSNKKASIKTVFKTVQGFLVPDSIPIGMVVEFPSDNIPDNWLLCNGQAVSRTDYAELFAAIGTTWGAGDGSTTFNVPTKEGLVTVGKKASDSDFNTLGKTGGTKTQEHDLNTNSAVAAIEMNTDGTIDYGETQATENIAKTYTLATGGSGTNKSVSNKWGTKLYGKTSSESNLQPYTTSNFIIKAKQSSGVVATVVDNLNSTSATDALSAKQGKILNDKISEIIESGSNSNGSYVKWSDGTMICTKRVGGTVNITEKYYEYFYHNTDSDLFNLGDYAQEFIELPRLNVQFVGGNCQWIGSIQNNTKLHIGDLHILSVTSKSAGGYYDIIAVGKWK